MATDDKPIKLRAASATDVGMVRDHNEDSVYVDPEMRFFVVADGMGGHAAGEVASAMAVDAVKTALDAAGDALDAFARGPTDEGRRGVVSVLEGAVRAAHQAVFSRGAQETDKQGMGTTLDVLLVTGPEAFIAHVGDSRTYLLRDGKAAQITTDHTVAEVLVIEGKLSIEEAQSSPLRTILVNAIGVSPDVGVEMSHVRLREGDRLLLCSDGLHDYFPADDELANHLSKGEIGGGLGELVELAKRRGGHDNITGVAIEVLECLPVGAAKAKAVSNGVPREVGIVDTMPVDAADVARAADEAAGKKRGGSKKKKDRQSSAKATLPMGMVPPDAAAKRAPSTPPADDGATIPEEKPAGMQGEPPAAAPALRKTEPMQSVDEDAQTIPEDVRAGKH
jgi:protein phosphatase